MTHQPPGTFLPPTADQLAAHQQAQIRDLQQRYQPTEAGPYAHITATNPAPITEERQTGRVWPWRTAWRLQYIIATADGVTDTTVVTIRRGTPDGPIDAVTLTWDDDGVIRQGHDVVWTIGDYLDMTVTGAVSHLVVQLFLAGVGDHSLTFSVPSGGGG